ncbi:uncharacterized protein METZ01_LOCUS436238, partial [marine metagenome]
VKFLTPRILPSLFVATTIFLVSHIPGEEIYIPLSIKLIRLDFVYHIAVYFIFATSICFGVRARSMGANIIVILIAFTYGISDEIHQIYVPGRAPAIIDVMSDLGGTILGVSAWGVYNRRRFDNS